LGGPENGFSFFLEGVAEVEGAPRSGDTKVVALAKWEARRDRGWRWWRRRVGRVARVVKNMAGWLLGVGRGNVGRGKRRKKLELEQDAM
jgi:hypothetical protein